ncbi:hypothetical protein N431DRAFT_557355 [Stipitochalara longipes BDJ]|nr:hypothetical protein N431DRAFT_557355 [Stipitochalara longipes BDJ]
MGYKEELDDAESSDSLLAHHDESLHKSHSNQGRNRILFIVSILFNIFFVGFDLAYWIVNRQTIENSYENGFALELGPAKPKIEMMERVFTGEIRLDQDGNYFTDGQGDKYGGMPSQEVDDAWRDLLDGLNIGLHPSEANLGDTTFQWPGSGDYFSGLEVFHSLHCLNRVREALYPDYYPVSENPKNPSRQDHIEHCINHLRQAIQCHSDLTPMQWYLVGDRIILKTETRHMCRNFENIHNWAVQKKSKIYNKEDIRAMKNGSLFIVD